jgi:hypothetical protein
MEVEMSRLVVIPQEEIEHKTFKQPDGDYVTVRLGQRKSSGFKTRWTVSVEMLGRIKYVITDDFGISVTFTRLEYFGIEDGRIFFDEDQARKYYQEMIDIYGGKSFIDFLKNFIKE